VHAVGLGVREPGVELREGAAGVQLVPFEGAFGVLVGLGVCLVVGGGDWVVVSGVLRWGEGSGVDGGVEGYRLICLLFGVGGVPFL